MLHPHVTQIFVVVRKDALTLGAGPLGRPGRSASTRRGGVTPGSRVVLVPVVVLVVVIVVLLLFLLLLPPPVLSVGILRPSGRLGFEDDGSGRVGRRGGGVSGVGLRLRLFDGWSSVSRLRGRKDKLVYSPLNYNFTHTQKTSKLKCSWYRT